MSLLRFFREYLGRYSTWILLAVLSVPLYGLASVAMVALIEPIFGEVLLADNTQMPAEMGGFTPSAEPVEDEPTGLAAKFNLKLLSEQAYAGAKRAFGVTPDNVLYFTPILFIFVFFTRSMANFVSGYSFQRIGLGITTDIRNDLYRSLLGQSSRFHQRHNSGELVSRVVNDVTVMQTAVTTRLLDLFQQSITLLFLLYLLLSTDWKLALSCLVVTPVVLFPVVRFGKGMRKTSHRSQERLAEVTQLLAEGVRGHRVVKAFGATDYEHGRFADATGKHMRVSLWAQILANLSSPVIETISTIALAGFLIYAGSQIRAGDLSPPMLVQFLANLMLLYDPIRKLNRVNLILQQALAAAHRVRALLHEHNEIQAPVNAPKVTHVERSIHFDHVTFSYEDEPVLKNVELKVRKGEIVALVGPSGAGKSSLVNLLPRFFDPNEGAVRIDERDVREIELDSLRGLVGIVSQETMLFNDSVRNNIAYGQPDVPHARVEAAARAAFAHEFIIRMAQGYDTPVGEHGLQLSGGQRQRLAIARAILKDAPILILDEATSQLDSESESLVQKALANLMQDRTTLVVAHRLATIIRSDRIIVMENGEITEQGAHDELLARGGTYSRLFELQFDRGQSA